MEYWQERQEDMYKAGEMQVNKYFTRLEKAFNQTRRELQKTIDAFYFRYAEENGLSFAAAQKKLDAEELGEAAGLYRSGHAEYWALQSAGQ